MPLFQRSNVVRLSLVFLCASLQAGAFADGRPGISRTARTLAVGIVLDARIRNEQAGLGGQISTARARCLNAYEADRAEALMQRLLEESLTPEELRASDQFWATTAAAKWNDEIVRDAYTRLGRPMASQGAPFTDAEQQQVDDYVASPAGRKIVGDQLATNAKAQAGLAALIADSRNACP